MGQRTERGAISFLWLGAIVAILYLWQQNGILEAKVKACGWEIGTANYSIQYADDQLTRAKQTAWSGYQTMGHTLESLQADYQQRPNPCDKSFTGDMSQYKNL